MKRSAAAAGGAALGVALTTGGAPATAQSGGLTRGDAAILQLLSALEQIESDLWLQYAELGGVQTRPSELPGLPTGGSGPYIAALQNLDGDMPQYIHDNTEDEFSHHRFINGFLVAKGAEPVDLSQFATLQGSQATGANKNRPRITNLMQLTVDTTWWTRYRSRRHNPDLDPGFQFPPAVPSLSKGKFPAIPRTDADLSPQNHIQAIANTAAFHFAFIEQGGSSLYPTLAQKATDPEVLRILLSIGPTETSHFQTWHDKAGNAVSTPLAPLTDPSDPALVFPNLNAPPFPPGFGLQDFQTNLIMPEPCPFLDPRLPVVSIIRPTSTQNSGAMAAVESFIADGLFIGQSREFFQLLRELASQADAARYGQN
ncbi:MAG: ferritin-like domain-containing protein [Alphaproteobacteria bacterium]|nr:ferritin-like domain-containing protein [Alphaproteobacteria bacterium]